jgi:alkylated DNA repair protein (DNA oxidative demethylase)
MNLPLSKIAWKNTPMISKSASSSVEAHSPDLLGPADEVLPIGSQAAVLRGFALPYVDEILAALPLITSVSPFRHMSTRGGYVMSIGLTNCGELGWTTDRHGYRYTHLDPETGNPWPDMPEVFLALGAAAAKKAGFDRFHPDACLINEYLPGTRLTLHQDKNEQDYKQPIVSVSLGIPAVFLWGGAERSDKQARVPMHHGDVAVWGGVDRLRYHGVLPITADAHPLLGGRRINLTLRKAG